MDETPLWMLMLLGALLGASTGSYLGVCVERIPRGESLMTGSHCVCTTPIPPWRNVPVLTWCLQGGRAACCSARIPARYLLGELTGALVGAAVCVLIGPLVTFAGMAVLTVVTLVWSRWHRRSLGHRAATSPHPHENGMTR